MATKAWLRAAIECACGLLMGMMVAALLLRAGLSYKSFLEATPGVGSLMAAPDTAAQLLRRQLANAAHWHGARVHASSNTQSQTLAKPQQLEESPAGQQLGGDVRGGEAAAHLPAGQRLDKVFDPQSRQQHVPSTVPHSRKMLQGTTLVQGSGEFGLANALAPPPPPPPFTIIPAPVPVPAPAAEPLSVPAAAPAPVALPAPTPAPAPLPLALPAATPQPLAAPAPTPAPAPAPVPVVPVPVVAAPVIPAPTTAAPITPAPMKAPAPKVTQAPTPQPTVGKTAQLAAVQPATGKTAAPVAAPAPQPLPLATPKPTAQVVGAGVPVQPPPPPIKNPSPADIALAAGPAAETHGIPPAPPLAPPARIRAPFTPITAPQGSCTSPYGIISGNPQLSLFNGYITTNSLQGALSTSNQSITVFAPVNDAFNVQAFEVPFYGCTNITCLLNVHPEVGRSLIAYATLPESVPTGKLTPGAVFNTTAAISLTPLTITAAQPNPLTGQITLDGKGSDAAILQGDIAACGTDASPSYVHIVDTVLLPFLPSMTGRPNAAGTAYSATGPNAAPAPGPAADALAPAAGAAAAPTPQVDSLGVPAGGALGAGAVNANLLAAGGRRRLN